MVKAILSSEVYIGNSVHNKQTAISFRNKKKVLRPKDEWYTVENTHEPIISKSKVVNLKKHYSEFLGFKIKAVRKGGKFIVRSHMSDKAVKRETEKLKEQIKAIEHCKNAVDGVEQILRYNSMVIGIHNYYQYATFVNIDCKSIQFRLNAVLYNRLKWRLKKHGTIRRKYIAQRYGASQTLRFINGEALCPIGYVQTKNPMYKKKKICKYTAEGREEIHRNLKFDETVMTVLHMKVL